MRRACCTKLKSAARRARVRASLALLAVAAGALAAADEPSNATRRSSGGRPATAARCPRARATRTTTGPRDIADRRELVDARPSVLRADRRKRPRVRDLSSTRRRNERIARRRIRARWQATDGKDPLFAAIDGRNCPHLPRRRRSRALAAAQPRPVSRVLAVAAAHEQPAKRSSPSSRSRSCAIRRGCNTHPVHGLQSAAPTISVYRRPRPVANLKYVTAAEFGVGPFSLKDAQPALRDPATGRLVNMNMIADAREPTLRTQAISAALTHLETKAGPSAAVLERLIWLRDTDLRGAELPRAKPAISPSRTVRRR